MGRNALGRILLLSSLFLCMLSPFALADERERFAQETGLDTDLLDLLKVDVGGTELTIVFVFINQRTFDSKISPFLRQTLLPYAGMNAVYVNPNIKTVVTQFGFSALEVSVEQGGTRVPLASDVWVEITPGFMSGRFEVNPAGSDRGSGSEGILVLGEGIDPSQPFDLIYGGQRARIDLVAGQPQSGTGIAGGPIASTTSHDPVFVPLIGDAGTLRDVFELPEYSSEAMAALFDLPKDDVRTVTLDGRDSDLELLYIRLTDAVRSSALGGALVEALEPLIDTGAIMVWAYSSTGAPFSPWSFYIKQGGTNHVFFSSASFVELTAGFLRLERIDAGTVAAGVIRLPRGVTQSAPYSLYYSASGVDFE